MPACRRPASAPGTSARPVSRRESSPGPTPPIMCVGAPGEAGKCAAKRSLNLNGVGSPTSETYTPDYRKAVGARFERLLTMWITRVRNAERRCALRGQAESHADRASRCRTGGGRLREEESRCDIGHADAVVRVVSFVTNSTGASVPVVLLRSPHALHVRTTRCWLVLRPFISGKSSSKSRDSFCAPDESLVLLMAQPATAPTSSGGGCSASVNAEALSQAMFSASIARSVARSDSNPNKAEAAAQGTTMQVCRRATQVAQQPSSPQLATVCHTGTTPSS
eukprot:7378111-Prymnesium_polylepis.2